jgi:hypothetical protein
MWIDEYISVCLKQYSVDGCYKGCWCISQPYPNITAYNANTI